MMKLMKVVVSAALISIATSHAAMAGGSVSLFGAGVIPQSVDITAGGVTATVTGKLGFGGGALGEWTFHPRFGIEAGGVYLARKMGITALGADLGELTSKSVYIPVGFRWRPNNYLSLEAGGFYDVALDTDGVDNYGAQGGLRVSLPVSGVVAFFVEGRYNLGLKDISGVKRSDLALVMVGLSFGGGKK